MNTQVKIIISLLLLMASGCVHHPRRYYAYPNEYEYSRTYDSYYNYPVYDDRRVYVRQPIVVEGSRQRIHEYQERPRYTNLPNKHQKPKFPRYDNNREYQRSTGKQTKVFVTKQPRYDRRNDSSRQYVDESRSFKQYTKTYKGRVNNSSSDRQETGFSNQYPVSRPYRESKHRKRYNNTSTRKFPMGKSSKR